MPRLTIVVVTYNSRGEIAGCLDALTQSPPADSQIVVVDSGSTDGTLQLVRERWPAVQAIDAGGNLGFARANNLGIRRTESELVLLLNPDAVAPAGSVDRLVAALDRRPDAAAAGPRLVDARGRAELSFGHMIGPLAELRQKLLVAGHGHGWPPIAGHVERMTRRSRVVDWVSGACLLVRRADAEAVGLLDERYFMYCEDVDFCAALREAGRMVLFVADTHVVHLRGRSAASAPRQTTNAYRRSQIAFYRKHHPAWAPLLYLYLKARGALPDTQAGP